MLFGSTVVLRHVEAADLDALIRGMSDSRARGDHVPGVIEAPARIRAGFAANGLASREVEHLLITRAADGAIIGTIGHAATHPNFSEREIGYQVFALEHRGRGYAFEAVGLLVDYLFANFPHRRLRGQVDPRHAASVRILAGHGFMLEGVLREAMLVGGRYLDQAIYGLLRADWARARGLADDEPSAPSPA